MLLYFIKHASTIVKKSYYTTNSLFKKSLGYTTILLSGSHNLIFDHKRFKYLIYKKKIVIYNTS